MKNFLKEYWPFIPLILILTIAILAIGFVLVGDIRYNKHYQSNNFYNDNSLRN